MKNVKAILVPALVLFLICLFSTALLALTNQVTEPIIAELSDKTESEAKIKVLPAATSFAQKKAGFQYYEGTDGFGKSVGYIFTTVQKGYGGDIKILTGIDKDGKVTGIEFLEITETAGLGMKVTEESFKSRFIGKINEIYLSKDKKGDGEIDALTGATISSRAVTNAVNEALQNYKVLEGGAS